MLWLTLDFPDLRHPAQTNRPPTETAAVLSVLACWAGRFTSQVSVGCTSLSMEIAGSLRLFGGLESLLQQIRDDLAVVASGMTAGFAVAPTPLASRWLARAGGAVCTNAAASRAALERVPVTVLDLPRSLARRLEGFGLYRIGQLLALPRASLGRRLGQSLLIDLARALGELPDPQPWFVFPDRFDQRLELPAPVEAAPVLLFAARRLIAALCGWLAVRNAVVREIHWIIDHDGAETTCVPLRFSTPTHVAVRFERVLKERLDRLTLPSPALSLRLQIGVHELRDAGSQSLFDGGGGHQDALAELLDRFVARLGRAAVQRLVCHADHRPEAASHLVDIECAGGFSTGRAGDVVSAVSAQRYPARPLWLIDPPEPLREAQGRLWRDGGLHLLAGPERIEAGWWDGSDARRDYFIAKDARERWLWIFRDPRSPGGWFLQGWFS